MTQTAEKHTKSQHKKPHNVVNQVAVAVGRAPVARYVAKRKIELVNQQIAKQLKHMDFFGLNYSTLMGAFIKASQSQSVRLFDEYISKLIFTTRELVKAESLTIETLLDEYKAKGWVFQVDGKPQTVTVNIYRNCLNDFADLLLDIDVLISQLNFLEKTPQIKTPELFVKVSDWVRVPSQLNKKVVGLTKRLNDNFSFDVRNKAQKFEKINFGKINNLLESYEKEQFEVLNTKAPQPVTQIKNNTKAVKPKTVNKTKVADVTKSVKKSNLAKDKPTAKTEESKVTLRNW